MTEEIEPRNPDEPESINKTRFITTIAIVATGLSLVAILILSVPKDFWKSECEKKGHVYSRAICGVVESRPEFITKNIGDKVVVFKHTEKDSLFTCIVCYKRLYVPFNIKDSVVDTVKPIKK